MKRHGGARPATPLPGVERHLPSFLVSDDTASRPRRANHYMVWWNFLPALATESPLALARLVPLNANPILHLGRLRLPRHGVPMLYLLYSAMEPDVSCGVLRRAGRVPPSLCGSPVPKLGQITKYLLGARSHATHVSISAAHLRSGSSIFTSNTSRLSWRSSWTLMSSG